MGGTSSIHERNEKSYSTFVGNPEGKRPPGRCRRRWEYNIRMVKVKLSLSLTKHYAMRRIHYSISAP